MIYDYLFYKGFQLAKKSKNWEDTPILFAVMVIGWCFILNFAAIIFLLEGLNRRDLGFGNFISTMNEYKYFVGVVIMLLIWLYYAYKGRWKRIIAKYEEKEKERGKSIHPAIIIVIAYVGSFILGMLTAMYRNSDGIFR